MTGQTFLVNSPDNFKATLDNITIYGGDTYNHEVGMTSKARKEAVIPQPDKLEEKLYESAKYI